MDVCGLGVLCCLRRYQAPRYEQEVDKIQVQLDTSHMGMTELSNWSIGSF